MSSVPTFTHSSVRDLAWVIGSPVLVEQGGPYITTAECEAQLEAALPWLTTLDADPAPLEAALAQSNRANLGGYFESLVAFWLQHRPDTTLIGHNIQVTTSSTTLGEFDFIYNHKNIAYHLEAAVKFYLHHEGLWYGPKAQDRLDIKCNKLTTQQTALSHTPEGKASLTALGITTPVTPQILLKGYLFTQKDAPAPNLSDTTPPLAPKHLHGWWQHYSTFVNTADTTTHWAVLTNKKQWLASYILDNAIDLGAAPSSNPKAAPITTQELLTKLDPATPTLIVTLGKSSTTGSYTETSRGFIVPDTWPGG